MSRTRYSTGRRGDAVRGDRASASMPSRSVRTMTRIAAEVESEPVAVVPPLRHPGPDRR